jgi:hypothetical protein
MRLPVLIGLLLVGGVILTMWRGRNKKVDLTREQVAVTIQNFLDGSGGQWDWDDFLSFQIADPRLEEIRERCNGLSEEFPATEAGHYCGPGGVELMRRFISELRQESA